MKTIEEFLKEKESIIDLELSYYYQEGQSFNDFNNSIHDGVLEQDIIYYSRAIEFLKENDPSLKESLSLAADLGYTAENLSSEVLATLLHQEKLFEEFGNMSSEIEAYFEEYENYLMDLEVVKD